jgi:DNA-binding MarR family transcriptional regulator
MQEQKRQQLIKEILLMATAIFESFGPIVPPEWLSSDLSVTQLRVLLILKTTGPSRMSNIAASLGVALPTATGIIDNLVGKNLVTRENTPQDRRIVICKLSAQGEELIGKLWEFAGLQIGKLLELLTLDQLQQAVGFVKILQDNAAKLPHKNI